MTNNFKIISVNIYSKQPTIILQNNRQSLIILLPVHLHHNDQTLGSPLGREVFFHYCSSFSRKLDKIVRTIFFVITSIMNTKIRDI